MKTELQKQRDRDYSKRYYQKYKNMILAKNKARREAKKVNKELWVTLQAPKKEVHMQAPKIQDMYIHDFYSRQLDKIEKALWWICFAITLVGISIVI